MVIEVAARLAAIYAQLFLPDSPGSCFNDATSCANLSSCASPLSDRHVVLASNLFSFLSDAGVLAFAALLGCSGGSEKFIPVSGVVTEAKRPLARGAVSLHPDREKGNKSLHHPTGTIDAQGRYIMFTAGREGAPAGWYKVVVFSSEPVEIKGKAHPGMPKSLINVRYNQSQTTPLTIEVKPDASPGSYDFDLQN